MYRIYETSVKEYDQDDEERLVYEANYQECQKYLRSLDDDTDLVLDPDESELEEESTIELFEMELDYA